MRIKTWCLSLFILLGNIQGKCYGQDVHFSQFYELSILNNPSLTGVFNEDYKVNVLFRNQWSSIAIPYKTTVLNAEAKIRVNNVNDYMSFGLLAYSDKAGSINFSTIAIYPCISYNKSLDDKFGSYINAAFTGGYVQRSVEVGKMTFDNQYQGGNYNSSNGSGEGTLPYNKLQNWDLGAGLSFNSSFDLENKINYYLGVSVYHLTTMAASLYEGNNDIKLDTRWNGNLGLNYNFNSSFGARLYLNYMLQSPYKEIMTGAMVKWSRLDNLNQQPFALDVGMFFRYNDALIPTVKAEYKRYALALSYDINISTLRTVTNMRGAFEISLSTKGMFMNSIEDKHMCPRF